MSQNALVIGAKQGHQEAFDLLYQWLLPQVYRYALAQTGDQSAAEEITSESFMVLVRSLETLPDHDVAVLAWIRGVVRNRSVDWIRRQVVRRRADAKLAELPVAGSQDPGHQLELHEAAVQVQRGLGQLPQRYREVLEFRYFDDLPLPVIAEVTGQSVSAVHSLLYRARKALREQLRRAEAGMSEPDCSCAASLLEADHDAG